MTHHLQRVPDDEAERLLRSSDPSDDPLGVLEDLELAPIRRPTWWRWVALAVVVALVVATPLAYVISLLLR